MVVLFEIGNQSPICPIIHAKYDEGEEAGDDPEGVLPRVVPRLLLEVVWGRGWFW